MIKNNILVLLFLFCISSPAFSQSYLPNNSSRNSFYLEVLGNGLLYSINYDRILKEKEKSAWVGRIGITYAPPPDQGPGILAELNLLLGSSNHHFELGAGSTYYYLFNKKDETLSNPDISLLFFTTRIGYRFQKKEGGFLFRAALTPLYAVNVDQDIVQFEKNFILYGGVSIGYTLKIK